MKTGVVFLRDVIRIIFILGLALVITASRPGITKSYPPDPTADIGWSSGYGDVADIQAAFNDARATEETQLGITMPDMTLPDQATWNAKTDSEKALWLINQERTVRGVTPLHGTEPNVTGVAQYYANYLLSNDVFGHEEDGHDPWQRLEDNAAIGACHDFLNVAENLAVFVTSGSSISLPVERSIYDWLYNDASSSWGHRHALLWYPYNDNGGTAGMEGFVGLGRAEGGPYQGPFLEPWPFASIVVMNVFDPCSTWNYSSSGVPDLAVQDINITEGNSGMTNAAFTVTLSHAASSTVTVDYDTSDGTATSGSDYNRASGQLTFLPGGTTQTINVPVSGDVLDEDNETFLVTLSWPNGANIADGQATATIVDNDPMPVISINDVMVDEGNSGTKTAVFTVSMSAVSGRSVTADYATLNNTASAGTDFLANSGSLIFAAGETQRIIQVAVYGDMQGEFSETFFLKISNPVNATLGDDTGIGTIRNDDKIKLLVPLALKAPVWMYLETFDGPVIGWEQIVETGGECFPLAGEYHLVHTVANKNVRCIAPLSSTALTTHYTIETGVRVLPGSDPITKVGLIFDWTDKDHMYRFLILPIISGVDNWWLQRYDTSKEAWVPLAPDASGVNTTDIRAGVESNVLRLERNGSQVKAFINGFLLWAGTDSTLPSGRIGIMIVADANLPKGQYSEAGFDYLLANAVP